MATVSFYLDTRRMKKNGKYPVKLNVFHVGQTIISTEFEATPETWTGTEYNKKAQNWKTKNIALRNLMNNVERRLYELSESGQLRKMDDKNLKEDLKRVMTGKPEKEERTLLDVMREFIGTKTKNSTISCYEGTINKIEKYDCGCTFDMVDRKWLSDFYANMKESGMKVNACGVHLRNIRSVFNYAIDEGYTNEYPFRKFTIPKEKTRKRNIDARSLAILRDYPCEEHQKKYRDIFMLMFYLIGINAIDLLNAKEIVGGRLEYRRSKTSRLYSIKIEPEAMEIINKYKGKDYLIDVLDRYGNYKDFLHRMNENLRKIGEVERKGRGGKKHINSLFPEISSYWSRHTWATIAASINIPKDVIAAALGHGQDSVTDIYIDFDRNKVDEANRKVIDFVNEIKNTENI